MWMILCLSCALWGTVVEKYVEYHANQLVPFVGTVMQVNRRGMSCMCTLSRIVSESMLAWSNCFGRDHLPCRIDVD